MFSWLFVEVCFLYAHVEVEVGAASVLVLNPPEPLKAQRAHMWASHLGSTYVRSTLTAPEFVSFVWEGASKRTVVQLTFSLKANGLVDTKLQPSLTQSNKRALKGSYLLNYILWKSFNII